MYPKFFVTSARFNDSGKAISLADISQISYIDMPFELYYGLTLSLMAGILLPVGYLYRIGAGVRFFVGRNLRVEVFTNADPMGRNRFRGIGGCLGIGYVAGM